MAIAVVDNRYVLSMNIGGTYLNAYIPSVKIVLLRLDAVNSELLCQLRPDYRVFLKKKEGANSKVRLGVVLLCAECTIVVKYLR